MKTWQTIAGKCRPRVWRRRRRRRRGRRRRRRRHNDEKSTFR